MRPIRRSPAIWWSLGLVAVIWLGGLQPAAAGQQEAREYYERAQTLYRDGKFEKAASLLKKAYEAEPNLTYQYNRIRALEGAERFADALEVLETYETPLLEAEGYDNVPELKRRLREKLDAEKATSTEESRESTETAPSASTTDDDSADAPDVRAAGGHRLAWSLVGTGGAALAAGGLLSTGVHLWGVDGPPSRGVAPGSLRTNRIVTASLLGLGTALTTTGVVLLFRTETPPADRNPSASVRPEKRARLLPFAGRRGVGAVFHVDF